MVFSPELAETRFGCGLSPVVTPPRSVGDMLDGLADADDMAARFPIGTFDSYRDYLFEARKLQRAFNKDRQDKAKRAAFQQAKDRARQTDMQFSVNTLLRCTYSTTPFRERLVAFWSDHFTAYGKNNVMGTATTPYIEDAIRPRITGRFGDMLVAVTTHPLMLHYLDQDRSVGPDSKAALQKGGGLGLNENLAREVMELHTLGVGGPYAQDDVRQLAELFTGMGFSPAKGFVFRAAQAEPGAETLLGKSYGGNPARVEPIIDALHDLAVHPATARHIARKLAVHFVADTPPDELVDHLAARYADTGGDLMQVYAGLLDHPAAWQEPRGNIKPPVDFIASAWRALAVDPDHAAQLPFNDLRRTLVQPLKLMGQPWQRPVGPDGWSEHDEAWLTPQGVATRLRWAVSAPRTLRPDLPEPTAFVDQVLGPYATEPVRFAARAAESKSDAIGLILASPAFQRR